MQRMRMQKNKDRPKVDISDLDPWICDVMDTRPRPVMPYDSPLDESLDLGLSVDNDGLRKEIKDLVRGH